MEEIVATDAEKRLTKVFKPKGIVAFTNCCRRCKYAYDEDDDFEMTESDGIWFFVLYLHLRTRVDSVSCQYESLKYLRAHKAEQEGLIRLWAKVVGLRNLQITWPESEAKAVVVNFDPVQLV